MKNFFLLSITLVLYTFCFAQKKANTPTQNNSLIIEGKLFTSLFQQQAAEYKALCFQAYNIATLRLDQIIANSNSTKPKAIVTDIDETVLDNSPYAVYQAFLKKEYEPASWVNWTAKAAADTLAGALTFFKYAASKNIEIFYISNRAEQEREGTLKNLKKFEFPYADNEHLILKTAISSKEPRRQELQKTHDIVLLIGDNLSDFSDFFDQKTKAERTNNVQQLANEFGKKFIVLPNANYGDWEGALFNYNNKLTPIQKDSIIKSVLKSY